MQPDANSRPRQCHPGLVVEHTEVGMNQVWPIISVGLFASLGAGQTLRSENILPAETDPAINAWLPSHYVAISLNTPLRNKLFLYIHGQGGTGGGATELVKTAAEEGFHAVGLSYPCDWSPFTLCQAGGDPDCPEKLRREAIEGADLSALIAVSRANSLENRLIKLLAHLDTLHSGEGWTQFAPGGQIQWDRIVLWGHSMGGGNAGIIARHHELSRVCMSAPAADGGPGSPAAWWSVHATPASSYFGFCHNQDQLETKVYFWDSIGMGDFGPVVNVAFATPPYSGTHKLSTSVEPTIAGQYHNSVIADNVTPRLPGGIPVYKETWRHMMTSALPASCYANCDGSTGPSILTANDFQCFLNRFAFGDSYANCDASNGTPVLTPNDFLCFLNTYAAGCT
jgi:hypothetical protein